MPVVTTSKLNTVMDKVVAQLKLNIKPQSGLNLITTVPFVKRVLRVGDQTGASKPLLAVQLVSWRANPHSAQRFTGTLTYAVHVIVDAPVEEDEQQLLNICTDVVRAVLADHTLGGLVVYTYPVEFSAQVDAANNSGNAHAAVTFEAVYIWDAATP